MAEIDIDALIKASILAASEAIGDDITEIEGFARQQFATIAEHSAKLAEDRLAGRLTEDEFEDLIAGVPALVKNTVNTLRGLALITLEKAWNAIAETLQTAIRTAVAGAI